MILQVIPIIERGLRERGTEAKKRAAQIFGNLASLTDSMDFIPYLSSILPLVHIVLVDPVPEARATAAKALKTLVERLGKAHFPDVIFSLLRPTLRALIDKVLLGVSVKCCLDLAWNSLRAFCPTSP